MKIKELNIEVMRTKDTSLYNNSKVPKGWKRIEGYQLVYILESKYRKKFLKELDGERNWFWIKKRKQDKYFSALGEYEGWLHVDGDFGGSGGWGSAFGVFIRRIEG